jgi:hypothetical protein
VNHDGFRSPTGAGDAADPVTFAVNDRAYADIHQLKGFGQFCWSPHWGGAFD